MDKIGGAKRKIDEEIELAKQKAQAIAARLISDAAAALDSKRPRTSDPTPTPDYSSSSQPSSYPVSYTPQMSNALPTTQKITIPNAKVGVIIGRGGDMIKNLQARSGARIQITRDNEADPNALTREVELMGTLDQISRAQQLITDTIAEADAATAPNSNRPALPPLQPGAQQFVIKVPNDKVALVIGKGGETIKTMQATSGARIQVVPLHLPPGDTSTERNVYINGTQEQIESAKELVNEVISGNRLKGSSGTNAYTQPAYAGAGWASQGQPPPAQQPPAYGYTQPGAYAMPPPPYYAGYPPQATSWDQQANTYAQAPHSSTPPNVGYNYSQMPSTAGYDYSQGYPQQPPSYGQDVSGQAQAPSATSSQPDGSAAGQVSQPYGAPPAPAPPAGANGYSAYPSYSGAPAVQPAYSQTGYPYAGYGQQQEGQVANQASYPYYGQSGYPPPQSSAPASYYQGAYPAVPPPLAPPQIHPQATNGVPQSAPYGVEKTDDVYPTTVTGGTAAAAADDSKNPQS